MDNLFRNLGVPRGLAVTILDMFEDVLDKYGIMIPDEDRTGEEGEACLYGMTYGELEDMITSLLSEYIDEE